MSSHRAPTFLFPSRIHTPPSVPSNLSPPLAPPLPGSQDSIIYSSLMLCMIWAIDEAISRSSLRAPSSFSLSPCCLMFQFGGSKHSIRQINCLMHVISQTVYERGAPRTGSPSHRPSTAATSFSLPCFPPAHCLLSYRRAHLSWSSDAGSCAYKHEHESTKSHIYSCMHTSATADLCINPHADNFTAWNNKRRRNLLEWSRRLDMCRWLCLWAGLFSQRGYHETFHEMLWTYRWILPLIHFRKWSCFTQLSHALLTDNTRSYTLFPPPHTQIHTSHRPADREIKVTERQSKGEWEIRGNEKSKEEKGEEGMGGRAWGRWSRL